MNLCGTKEIITNASIKLIFGNVSNFNNLFEAIHKNFNCDDFLELKDMDITDFTDKFLSENNISFDNIRNNKFILKKFVKEAKRETNISQTELANFLGLSRNIVGYQYRKP